MAQTLQKNIRVTAEQWDRIEKAARERNLSPNQFVIELANEALDRPEWPRTEAEIKVARASLFAAQAPCPRPNRSGPRAGGPGNPRIHLNDRAGSDQRPSTQSS